MVYHLLRKFAAVTEIFIPNQINALPEFKHSVLTIRNLGNHSVNGEILASEDNALFSTKTISRKSVQFFNTAIQQEGAELVHGHYLTDARFFYPFTRSLNVPKICSCYGYDVSSFPRKFGYFSKRYVSATFKEYDLFLAMSNDMKADLIALGCPEQKVFVHYHGINTDIFQPVRRHGRIKGVINLLTIASLYQFKGHLTVLKALVLLKKLRSDICFTYRIVGDGPEMNTLLDFVKENALQNDVLFEGRIGHGQKFLNFLKQADIFLHPSVISSQGTKEGIPGTIVEAMSSGLPVISTKHAGIPSIITDGETGILIDEGDHLAMFNKLCILVDDESLRQSIGDKARSHATKSLDLTMKARDLAKLYRSLIKP